MKMIIAVIPHHNLDELQQELEKVRMQYLARFIRGRATSHTADTFTIAGCGEIPRHGLLRNLGALRGELGDL